MPFSYSIFMCFPFYHKKIRKKSASINWSESKYQTKIFTTSGRGRIALSGFIELHNKLWHHLNSKPCNVLSVNSMIQTNAISTTQPSYQFKFFSRQGEWKQKCWWVTWLISNTFLVCGCCWAIFAQNYATKVNPLIISKPWSNAVV